MVSRGVWRGRHLMPGGALWERTNHRGEIVTMREGPAWALGALAGVLAGPGLDARQRAGVLVAGGSAAALGIVDDLAETGRSKGLRGHLGALRQGTVTTGAVKIIGISVASVVAVALAEPRAGRSLPGYVGDLVVAGGVVAGTANLVNLLDLRPGRALKLVLLHAPGMLGAAPSGVVQGAATGASLALLQPDLGEQAMLGDGGANAAGALLGMAVVLTTAGSPAVRPLRVAALAGLVTLTVLSERVSFTKVIEATPGLRELDGLGRRPTVAPAS